MKQNYILPENQFSFWFQLEISSVRRSSVSVAGAQPWEGSLKNFRTLHSIIINTTAKANDTTDILQTFR